MDKKKNLKTHHYPNYDLDIATRPVLSLLSFLSTVFSANPESHSISSLSWSGYIIAHDFTNPNLQVTGINASWTVPEINVSTGNGYSSAWIGIGGQSDSTLIQLGTEHNSVNGQTNYYAWYELLPSFSVRISDVSPFPGDIMVASIDLVNSDTNQWKIEIRDTTNGQAFSKTVVYNSTQSSGEWIVERPTVNKQLTNLSNFGNITFQGCYLNTNYFTNRINNFTYSKIQMINQQNTQLASVSPLDSDGSSFTVSYKTSS